VRACEADAPLSVDEVFGGRSQPLALEVYDPWDLAFAGGAQSMSRVNASCADTCGTSSADPMWCIACDLAGGLVAAAQKQLGDGRPALLFWMRRPQDYISEDVNRQFRIYLGLAALFYFMSLLASLCWLRIEDHTHEDSLGKAICLVLGGFFRRAQGAVRAMASSLCRCCRPGRAARQAVRPRGLDDRSLQEEPLRPGGGRSASRGTLPRQFLRALSLGQNAGWNNCPITCLPMEEPVSG
jgi:hypothetical protein